MQLALAVITAVAGVVTALGVLAAFGQLSILSRQTSVAVGAATSNLYGLVSEGMQAINRTFLDIPGLKAFFYLDEDPALADADLGVRIETMCESLMDFADSVVEQKRAHPTRMDWTTWDAYFRFLYAKSRALRGFLCDNADFYPDYVLSILGLVHVRERHSGVLLSRWQVFEAPTTFRVAAVPEGERVKAAPHGTPEHDAADPCQVVEGPDEAYELARSIWPNLDAGNRAAYLGSAYPWMRTWAIRRLGGCPGMCVAEVSSHGDRSARVVLLEHGVGERAAAVLRAWITGTIRSTRVNTVVFTFGGQDYRCDPNESRSLDPAEFRIYEYWLRRRLAAAGPLRIDTLHPPGSRGAPARPRGLAVELGRRRLQRTIGPTSHMV